MPADYSIFILLLLAIVFIVVASSKWKVHPFLALLAASIGLGLASNMPLQEVILAVNNGFGSLMGYIGLIVIMGSIIGVILEKSGAALKIATLILDLVGKKRPTMAMTLIGATVSIPVFCDSGFIILSSLNDAIAKKAKVKKASLALALASGLYTTHTLIPPTPGPITAAGNIGAADYIGTIMLIGFLVSIPTLIVAWLFAKKRGELIETEDLSTTSFETDHLPAGWKAVLPILLPIVLIGIGASLKFLKIEGGFADWLIFFGHPMMALFIGLIASFSLFPKWEKEYTTDWIGEGIKLAGPILIITGAGGAFGGVLKATPLADQLGAWITAGQSTGAVFLILAFAIAAVLKTAQGSSTNALVITSSMLAPLVIPMGFDTPFEMALVVMALGGGAMTVSHANDSYFWVVSQFSGIQLTDAYRSYTLLTGLQGLVVLISTLLLFGISML